ncbi:hypothetical protein LINPERPRIM_LOCUS23728 [Linum perenne]
MKICSIIKQSSESQRDIEMAIPADERAELGQEAIREGIVAGNSSPTWILGTTAGLSASGIEPECTEEGHRS